MGMKTNKKLKIYVVAIACIIIMNIMIIFFPDIKAYVNQEVNTELIEKVKSEALSANIMFIELDYGTDDYQNERIASSQGASGVIIHKEEDKYFALTAKHVMEEYSDQHKFLVLGHDDLDFKDYLNEGGEYQGLEDFYQQFPELVLEYSDNKYDLAIVSFISDNEYEILEIAQKSPVSGDKVVAMSNPYGNRNAVTAGKIIREEESYSFHDDTTEYFVIKHTALISKGSSGSALLNEDLEIVGINLGGTENGFRKFIFGVAIANDRIHDFLGSWKNQKTN